MINDNRGVDVLMFGSGSYDLITERLPAEQLDGLIDKRSGSWNLNPQSYFAFIYPNVGPEGQVMIGTLSAGEIWGDGDGRLPLYEKSTVPKVSGHRFLRLTPYSGTLWEEISKDPHAICGGMLTMQPGGPARNTLAYFMEIADHISPPERPVNWNAFFIGGDKDDATSWFSQHLDALKRGYSHGNLDYEILTDPEYGINQALNIPIPEGRTLIRIPENMIRFDPNRFERYLAEKNGQLAGHDVIYINSMKNRDKMAKVADFLDQGYTGKVIVAPTTYMLSTDPAKTRLMLKAAHTTICNLREAGVITGHLKDENQEPVTGQKERIVRDLLGLGPLMHGRRVYVSDGGNSPLAAEIDRYGKIHFYSMSPFRVDTDDHVNAGDKWTSFILHRELTDGKDIKEVLKMASAFASCHVSKPMGTVVDKRTLDDFIAEHPKKEVYETEVPS